jgi:hypothetical protein
MPACTSAVKSSAPPEDGWQSAETSPRTTQRIGTELGAEQTALGPGANDVRIIAEHCIYRRRTRNRAISGQHLDGVGAILTIRRSSVNFQTICVDIRRDWQARLSQRCFCIDPLHHRPRRGHARHGVDDGFAEHLRTHDTRVGGYLLRVVRIGHQASIGG